MALSSCDSWKKQRDAGGKCTDMVGFHRLCATAGGAPDGLEGEVPTLTRRPQSLITCMSSTCGVHALCLLQVIAAVSSPCGTNLLMGRQRSWPQGMYSTLAGFVEPGVHCRAGPSGSPTIELQGAHSDEKRRSRKYICTEDANHTTFAINTGSPDLCTILH